MCLKHGSLSVGAIILAAGKSERFGSPKVLQQFRAIPFLTRITRSLHKAGVEKIILVLGHQAEQLIPQLPETEDVHIVINPLYENGQFSSLQAGIRTGESFLDGVLLCLIDHPHLQLATYLKLMKQAHELPKKILVAVYHSRWGHPVYLPGWLFAEILEQAPQTSLRDLFSRYPHEILSVETGDPGVREDIDTREDLDRLEKAPE